MLTPHQPTLQAQIMELRGVCVAMDKKVMALATLMEVQAKRIALLEQAEAKREEEAEDGDTGEAPPQLW